MKTILLTIFSALTFSCVINTYGKTSEDARDEKSTITIVNYTNTSFIASKHKCKHYTVRRISPGVKEVDDNTRAIKTSIT